MKSDIIFNMGTYTYVAKIRPGEKKGRYIAYFPSLPGCHTQGNSITDVIEMAKEALAGYLQTLKANGLPIPPEKTIQGTRSRVDLPLSVRVA